MPRRSKPWFRTSEDTWYTTHDGRQVNLGIRGEKNEAAAWRAWELLRTGQALPTVAPPLTPAPLLPQVTVDDVIRSFLDDARGRVAASTFELYRLFLTGFAEQYGRMPASAVTCPLAESYT